jgi:hypothetical protein
MIANLIHRKTTLGDYLLERKAAFRVLPEIVARPGDGATIFRGQFFVFIVDHHFQQFRYDVELGGAELIEQMVSLLSVHVFLRSAASA